MSDSKQAKFFCESCGSEVRANARFCPKCGRFFASVKCPKCGRVGDQNLFKNGCPDCGYAAGSESATNTESPKNLSFRQKLKLNKAIKRAEQKKLGESLPSWIYILTATALAVIIMVCLVDFLH